MGASVIGPSRISSFSLNNVDRQQLNSINSEPIFGELAEVSDRIRILSAYYINFISDVAYLDKRSYTVLQPAAWIPFLDTNETNGCLEVFCSFHKTNSYFSRYIISRTRIPFLDTNETNGLSRGD